MSHLDT